MFCRGAVAEDNLTILSVDHDRLALMELASENCLSQRVKYAALNGSL